MVAYTGAQLANALYALGVEFVFSERNKEIPLKDKPLDLITALAESEESRLRLSLIPLFFQHPEFHQYVQGALENSSPSGKITLLFYYTASVWLQNKYIERLNSLLGTKTALPDLFSQSLEIPVSKDSDLNLIATAQKHKEFSQKNINWLGTYEHGATKFIKLLETKNRWQK